MLVARVAPPLPDDELPPQVLFDAPSSQQVIELVAPPGGLLVRRLAADLGNLGYEVAWIRPMPFEADTGSLAPLLLMALTSARRASPAEPEPVMVVVESPTAVQAEIVVDQLRVPGVPEPTGPSVLLAMDSSQHHRARCAQTARVCVDVPEVPSHQFRNLIPQQRRSRVSIRRLSVAAGGRPSLIDSTLRSTTRIGASELSRIVARAREPGALTQAMVQHLLDDAPAEQLAALELAGHLGYAHARLSSLEPAMAESAHHPWWVPLTDGWWQVDPAWRPSLGSCAMRVTRAVRSVCLGRLVADLAEVGAIHEGIELCLNAGWPGLAADLLAGEADALLSSGRHVALARWLERLPDKQARSHPSLARLAMELIPVESGPGQEQPDAAGSSAGDRGPSAPALAASPRRRWIFLRSGQDSADVAGDPEPGGGTSPPQPESARLAGRNRLAVAVQGYAAGPGHDGARAGPTAHGGVQVAGNAARPVIAHEGLVRVEARLLGPFELVVVGQSVQHWRGNRGRMLLAYLLLHRARALTRDELGGAFWPDAAPDVVRNRLHVALYGLRRDLRAVCEHPIVVHGRRGFSLHPGIGLWLDTEAFDEALGAARQEPPGNQEGALTWYEMAIEIYRGDLLEDAPYEEWALLRRERLRLQHLDALDHVARLRFAVGRYRDCLDVCQQLIPGDLCREEIHRLAMRCYARLNQPHLAVRQYQQCERQLRDELGVAPDEATRQLYERIRRRELI